MRRLRGRKHMPLSGRHVQVIHAGDAEAHAGQAGSRRVVIRQVSWVSRKVVAGRARQNGHRATGVGEKRGAASLISATRLGAPRSSR